MVRRKRPNRCGKPPFGRGPVTVVGYAWYRKEQWERLRQVCPDVDNIEERFEDWHQSAESHFQQLGKKCEREGMRLVKVEVDIEELLRWCAANGLVPDGRARSRFTAEKASEIGQGQSGPSSPITSPGEE